MKKRLIKKGQDLTSGRIIYLMHGFDFFDEKPFKDMDEARECWEQHKDYLMTLQDGPSTFESCPPGGLPWAYYQFEGEPCKT